MDSTSSFVDVIHMFLFNKSPFDRLNSVSLERNEEERLKLLEEGGKGKLKGRLIFTLFSGLLLGWCVPGIKVPSL